MKARLSDQREKIKNGLAPLPLYTCLHVKSNVSAMIFQVKITFNACNGSLKSVFYKSIISKYYNLINSRNGMNLLHMRLGYQNTAYL